MDSCCHKGSRKLSQALVCYWLPCFIHMWKHQKPYKNTQLVTRSWKHPRHWHSPFLWDTLKVLLVSWLWCHIRRTWLYHFFMGQETNKPQVINYFIPTFNKGRHVIRGQWGCFPCSKHIKRKSLNLLIGDTFHDQTWCVCYERKDKEGPGAK